MKVKLTLKAPDAIECGLKDRIEDEDLRDAVMEKFVTYGEYVTIEIDTDTMTGILVAKK